MEVMHPASDAVLLGKQSDQRGVIVVTPVPGMVLEGQMVGGVGMVCKGTDDVFDEVMHASVWRPHLNLRITGDLQNSHEEGKVFQQPLLQSPLLPAIKPVTPGTPHLTPEKPW